MYLGSFAIVELLNSEIKGCASCETALQFHPQTGSPANIWDVSGLMDIVLNDNCDWLLACLKGQIDQARFNHELFMN